MACSYPDFKQLKNKMLQGSMSIGYMPQFYREIPQAYKEQTLRVSRLRLKGDLRMSFMACTKTKKIPESRPPSGVNRRTYEN